MQTSEESPLAAFDPEPERTFLANRRKAVSSTAVEERLPVTKMGDRKLRDIWIPKDHVATSDVVMPIIQANYWEIKPALINMVQHNPFKGPALENPHEHIRNFLEYCNTLKHNGVPPEPLGCSYFPFLCQAVLSYGFMPCLLMLGTPGSIWCKLSLRSISPPPHQSS